MLHGASCDFRKSEHNHKKTVTEACKKEKIETYRWLVCSLSLESCGGCETERRRRHMAWRAATSRANPCRATLAPHARFTRIALDQQVPNSRYSPQDQDQVSRALGQGLINKWTGIWPKEGLERKDFRIGKLRYMDISTLMLYLITYTVH